MKKNYIISSCVVFLIVACMLWGGVSAQSSTTTRPMQYPQAEWDRAQAILMHTPSVELFDGVIHPSAGLFEHYFDVDAAAREHQQYIALLKKYGIQVYTVAEILHQAEHNQLRKLAEQSLHYDCSLLADQSAAMEAYRQQVLDEMTNDDMIRCILFQPTVVLSSTEHNTGIEATYIHKPLMNLYFTRDQSITTPKGHIICKMNSTQRALETDIVEFCYRQIGHEPIYRMQGEGRLEGGDYIPAGTLAYLGCGMRTNQEAVDQLLANDLIGHDTLVVCRDHKFWQMQMHLDTYFNIIDNDLVTMVDSRLHAQPDEPEYVTVDVYARAAGTKDYHLICEGSSFVEFLHNRGIEIIGIAENDELHYANNYLCIAPRHIVAVGGQSEAFQAALHAHGVQVDWLNLESLIDGYGAAHCMTQVLSRTVVAN